MAELLRKEDNNHNNNNIDEVIESVKDVSGYDLSCYRRDSLLRHLRLRLRFLELADFSAYARYLTVNPAECLQFLSRFHPGVTRFFRDREDWEFLSSDIVPCLIDSHPDEMIRIWCIGCATGQEAYSLAIAFAKELGIEKLRSRIQIYATDINERSLGVALKGSFTANDLRDLSETERTLYFSRANECSFVIEPRIRQVISFFKHNVVSDQPLADIDLISVRNTLLFFNNSVQSKLYKTLHDTLADDGFLFLGKADAPKNSLFERINHSPVFRKKSSAGRTAFSEMEKFMLTKDAFQQSPCAQLICSGDGTLIMANEAAKHLLGIRSPDCGSNIRDLLVGRGIPLLCKQLQCLNSTCESKIVCAHWTDTNGEHCLLQIEFRPLNRMHNRHASFLVCFHRQAKSCRD